MKNLFNVTLLVLLLAPVFVRGQACQPAISFGGHSGKSEITHKEIESVKTLELVPACAGEGDKIISYDLTMKIKGQPVIYRGAGASIDPGMQKGFLNMKAGQKIVFDNVKVKSGSTVRNATGVVLTIKD